ncbi:MAG: serine hydrolase [Patescibacteria group bacterium]|nr:serine hydrolase [Patescibacteria group bacterium]
MFIFVIFHILSSLLFNVVSLSAFDNYGETQKVWQLNNFSEKVEKINNLDLSASSVAVLDSDANFFLFEREANEVRSIASISKVMAALVFMDLDINFEDYYRIQASDRRLGGRDYLFLGEEVKKIDLLALSLIPSDNTAVIALSNSIGLSEDDLVKKMNEKAKELKLYKTYFEDATGLSNNNVSTAKEVAIMTAKAFENELIADLAQRYAYNFETKNGRIKNVNSTNELLVGFKDLEVDGRVISGKTGYNILAGYCLTLKFSNSDGKEFISVVLNSKSIKDRFRDSEKIIAEVAEIYK